LSPVFLRKSCCVWEFANDGIVEKFRRCRSPAAASAGYLVVNGDYRCALFPYSAAFVLECGLVEPMQCLGTNDGIDTMIVKPGSLGRTANNGYIL